MKRRKIKMDNNYIPLPSHLGDETYPNGIFHFNISRIVEDIDSGILHVERETIDVKRWFKTHTHGKINETHLPTVDVSSSIIQAEIRPGRFEVIDGNHRIEKAYLENISTIPSYKVKGEQLIPYFKAKDGYMAFVEYWNSKL
ncbi:hypothetical protein [Anaerobacillus sp. 1_MG-2023]|uniref:hypothetical protein n=1 Tax=Anaerobacillus sp. 1_MG-2023 TaxID=3062655 RepID=UPI0026E32C06|nr:hypothetical protein [Anaerobacillus sp. 1_MG-2023]MDO6657861.1 hypothetical protein [Anaerobacillus sp. 1_MG-2023]